MKLTNFYEFLLERRIAQISTNIEVTFSFDIVKTKHVDSRTDLSVRDMGYNYELSNKDISDFVEKFKPEIAESIVNNDIVDQTQFVIRTKDLAMALIAEEVTSKYWKLIVKTVFPESSDSRLKIGHKQLVFDK